MELCSDGHDEVCYECRNCPLCEEIKEKLALESTIAELQEQIAELKDQVNDIQ